MMKRHSVRRLAAAAALMLSIGPVLSRADKFYSDDPLWKEPAPRHVDSAKFRALSDYYEFAVYPFAPPGELNHRKPKGGKQRLVYPAGATNTLGEVPDNSWYANRNYYKAMSKEEIQAGPSNVGPPESSGKWLVISAKNEGVTPGFTIQDSKGRRYLLKFDPLEYSELATATDTLVSKLFHALGYHVPENDIVHFTRDQLEIDPKTKFTGPDGKKRAMTERDVTEILLRVPKAKDGRYRGSTSLYLPGTPLGPHRYFGTRHDDPNDTVPHEHRRDQRGLWVHCAWLGHDDSRAINSLDMLHEEGGRKYVMHYLIDFGSALGSASVRPNSPRSGNYLFSWKEVAGQFFTLGLNVPEWAKAYYPNYPSVGRFEWKTFDPMAWRPEYINPSFENALPDDAFWAAKQVMAVTDDQIRWAVESGQYSNPAAAQWVVECLIKRRDRIGQVFFRQVLPLDKFRVEGNRLAFEDLGVKHEMYGAPSYQVTWANFDNKSETENAIAGATGFDVPGNTNGAYVVARIVGDNAEKDIKVYLRRSSANWEIVGIERGWVGKSKLHFATSGKS